MRPNHSWRTLALLLMLVGSGVLLPLSGCSPVGRNLRLSHLPDQQPADRGRQQQPYDLMPPQSPPPAQQHRADDRAYAPAPDVTDTVRISPDGKWMAFEWGSASERSVWVAQRDGRDAKRVSRARPAIRPTWSPDGSRLLFLVRDAKRSGTWTIWLAQMPSAVARPALTAAVRTTRVAWLPDSRRICYVSSDHLVVADTDTRTSREFGVRDGGGGPRDAAADSPKTAAPDRDDASTGTRGWQRDDADGAGSPLVSPDGRYVVFAVPGDGAWVASISDGRLQRLPAEGEVDAFAWAPGGRQVAFRNARDGQWRLLVVKP